MLYTHFGTNSLLSLTTLGPDFRTEVGMVKTEAGKTDLGMGLKWDRTKLGKDQSGYDFKRNGQYGNKWHLRQLSLLPITVNTLHYF